MPEGLWDCFADDVVRAVHIGIDASASAGTEQAPLDSFAHVVGLMTDWLVVKEAALAGMAFLLQDHLYSYQLCLVGEHVDEASMGDLHELLIVSLAHVRFLLPPVILADNERSYAFLNQMFDNAVALRMQIVVDLASTFIGEPFQLVRSPPSCIHLHQLAFQTGFALIVLLVD